MAEVERVRFEGSAGAPLAAIVEAPRSPRAFALFAHCFTCSKDLRAARLIAGVLVERGFGVVRFDFTGIGESGGDFAATTFSSNVADLLAAVDFLRGRGQAPALLVGHSLGGTAVLRAAPEIPEVRAVATIGAPSEPAHLAEVLTRKAGPAAGEEWVLSIGGRPVRLRRELVEDLSASRIREAIAAPGRALLVMHSPVDEVVGIEHARKIFEAARHPKSFVALDGASHLLSRARDARYAGEVIAAWARRYLPEAASEPAGEELPEGEVLVSETGPPYAQEIRAGRHVLRADEPERVGGGDTGPSPYDLLLAALGACTSMTLRMYAARKGWPLARVSVRLDHRRIHAEDCADCETEKGRVDEIRRRIRLEGTLDAGQRRRLLEIADRCPVHRTLEGEVKIRTSLAEE
ncbi:MAG: alpha/beta fold hydrolase [Acidobacteria bacterium]|nr:MAG: alpha/beta fold hydrolase [Acidobacteriota bacterium]